MLHLVCGADPREPLGYELARFSAIRRTSKPLAFIPLHEAALRRQGLYRRPHERRGDRLWCPISDAAMSTNFANSRFLTPWLSGEPWVLFADFCDMLFLGDVADVFRGADRRYAVMVVKQEHEPTEATKMDNQVQSSYPRKNWSSVMLWNRCHRANERLTVDMVNTLPGRDLHRFCWLRDEEIGWLDRGWNHLVGVKTDPMNEIIDHGYPKLLHFTLASPEIDPALAHPWARLWHRELEIMRSTLAFPPALPSAA